MSNATEFPLLDAVIPVKDRSTIEQCVLTLRDGWLRDGWLQTGGVRLGRILVCDGGSRSRDCLRQLAAVGRLSNVNILQRPHQGFNKGWLLNQGLQAAKAAIVLVSDADILWSMAALASMVAAVKSAQQICCVDAVRESEADQSALQMPKYAYRICFEQGKPVVEVYPAACPAEASLEGRPGCGLLCARRSLFFKVGGYRHSFKHWGWEDVDLLIRAQLLGYRVVERGEVVHLSHGNSLRNLPVGGSIWESRDRNIRICLEGLARGQLRGDLLKDPLIANSSILSKPIQTRYIVMPKAANLRR